MAPVRMPDAHPARAMLRRCGRSFHFASRLLDEQDALRCTRLYAFCRHIDDLADTEPDRARARERLDRVDGALRSGASHDPVVADFLALARDTGLDVGAARELVAGVRGDLAAVRMPDEAALLRYCYRVAGTVGVMMCGVLGVRERDALPYAIDLGIAMQLTNIGRDVVEDARADRRYLPASWVGDASVHAIAQGTDSMRPALRDAARRLFATAERYYDSGERGLAFLRPRPRLAILVAARLYRAIGRVIARRDHDLWRGRAAVATPAKLGVASGAVVAYLARPRRRTRPLRHDSSLHAALAGLPATATLLRAQGHPPPAVRRSARFASPPLDADLAILGGGCAGLSLALRLAHDSVPDRRVIVIEPREHYRHDRTWSFWLGGGDELGELAPLVGHRWRRWRLSDASGAAVHEAPDRPYATIPADRFYDHALTRLTDARGIDLRLGVRVDDVATGGDHVAIATTHGTIRAAHAVDTRPPAAARVAGSILFQVFAGAEVEVDRPLFDPSTAGLMEGMGGDDDGLIFTYVLPFSPTRALIEATRFAPWPLPTGVMKAELEHAVARITGGVPRRVLRSEEGSLPLGLPHERPSGGPRLVRAGTPGGAVRPASGYAFLRIQRWACSCARAIEAGKPPLPQPRDPSWMRFMDGVFLRVLRERPADAPALFMALARHVPPAAFVRFLSDEATAADVARVVWALPKVRVLVGFLAATASPAAVRWAGAR